MQIKDVRPESFVKQIRCDRCDRLAELGEVEFHEAVSIDLEAGYASIFGDGNDVQVDLCQHCLKATLGPWLRVSNEATRSGQLEARLLQFDPGRHGGEFPSSPKAFLDEPEDLPVQERLALTGPLGRLAQIRAFFGYSGRLFFAPLTGSIRGIRREYQRLERLERARRRRLSAFARRGTAAGDGIPAEVVIDKLRAKVEAARDRRIIGILKGRLDVPEDFDAPLPDEALRDFEGDAGKDWKLTVMARAQGDPAFAEALLDEAINLAAVGEPELAKRILCELAGLGQLHPAAKASEDRGSEEPKR